MTFLKSVLTLIISPCIYLEESHKNLIKYYVLLKKPNRKTIIPVFFSAALEIRNLYYYNINTVRNQEYVGISKYNGVYC